MVRVPSSHVRRWTTLLATVGLIAATAVLAPAAPAGAADAAMSISPTAGPAGTTITVSLSTPCGAAYFSSELVLTLTHLGGGPGTTTSSTTVGIGGTLRKGYVTVPVTATAGTYALDARCSIPFVPSIVYARHVFDVSGGPPLPSLTVSPGAGPVGTVVDVSGTCVPTKGSRATLTVAMFNREDPRSDHIVYAAGRGPGPVLHAKFAVPAYFAIGEATITGTCFDYYTSERPFAESSFEVQGDVGVSVGDSSVVEGQTGTRQARFALTLSEPTNQDTFVEYLTVDGDAKSGSDFDAKRGVAVVPAGATATSIAVAVRGDAAPEAKESFSVWIFDPSDGHVVRAVGVGRILDDDPTSGPKVSIGDASLVEGKRGTRSLRIPVTLSAATGGTVSVRYATANGTARSGLDYNAVSGTVSIAAGKTSAVVTVPIRVDQLPEPTESFTVKLSAPSGATIGRTTGVGKILDDDVS